MGKTKRMRTVFRSRHDPADFFVTLVWSQRENLELSFYISGSHVPRSRSDFPQIFCLKYTQFIRVRLGGPSIHLNGVE